MYIPKQFAETSSDELFRIIRENPLGVLVSKNEKGLDASHVPFAIDLAVGSSGALLAHVARANPIWQEVRDGDSVLVVFRGADGYISPNWYPDKQDTHRRVPTWNYEVVHVHGTIQVRDEEHFVRRVVSRLTKEHEAEQVKPWRMGESPPDFIAEELRHIVGIQINVTRLEGQRKLNQHHHVQDREGAIRGLEASGNHRLAEAMKIAMSQSS